LEAPHPPYSPDFAPSDFYLFDPIKKALRQVQQQRRSKEKSTKLAWRST